MAPSQRAASDHEGWISPLVSLLLVLALGVSTALGGWAGGGPIVWYGLIVYMALRQRDRGWMPTLFVPATVLFLLWFADAAVTISLPFLTGLLLAYLLDPMVDRMEGRLGRGKAILLLAFPVVLASVALILFVLPSLFSDLAKLAGRLPELVPVLTRAYDWVLDRGAGLGLDIETETLTDFLMSRIEQIAAAVGGAGLTVMRGVQGLISVVSFVVITPVVTFYLLRDFDRMREGLLGGVPVQRRDGLSEFLERVDGSISGYLRGQLLVGLMVGTLFFLGLTIMGFDYALFVGLSAVVLNLIPYVGSVITALIAVSVALLTDPTWASVLKVGLLYGGIQLLDAALVSPRVMGQSLDLHPVVVMVALLLGGQFFGLAGILLAVPVAAILKEAVAKWTPEVLGLLPSVQSEDEGQ